MVHFWQDQSGFLEAPFVRMLRMRSASLKILFTDKRRPTFDSPEYSPNTKHAIQQRMSWLKSIIGKYFVIPAIVNSVH